MRSIGTSEQDELRKQRTVRNFSIFLLVILVLSSVGYAFISSPSDSTATTSTTTTGVRQLGDRWVFGPPGGEIALSYGPEDTRNISVNVAMSLEDYVGEPLFLDIPNSAVLNEIGGVLQTYPSRIQEACYGSCERDLPEKDCSNNLISWKESNTLLVRQDQK
jgi:hypothetical protein